MTENLKPIPFTWDGDAMIPHPRFKTLCDRQYIIGENYTLVVHEDISSKSRGFFFASLREGWLNLPEEIAKEFPSPEYLRKKALVETGHATERVVVCDTEVDARRVAALARALSGYSVIIRSGNVVKVFEAKSQSSRAMNKEEFQKSQTDVLDYVSKLIGVKRSELQKAAGRSA